MKRQAKETEVPIPFDQAKKKLPKGNQIHAFRQSVGGILIGADWSRADILKAMKKYAIHETGEKAQKMNNGLAIEDEHGWLFIETKPTPPAKGE